MAPGPTSLMEEQRLRGGFAHWHNLIYEIWWVDGPLDVGALRDAWWRLCLRHDVLRRTYASPEEAHTHADAITEVEHHRAGTDHEALTTMRRSLGTPFDLDGPAFSRIVLVEVDKDRHLLGIAVDHIISDQMSWRYMCKDFSELYRQALAGEAGDTGELPTAYRRYAEQLRRDFAGQWGEERRRFWTNYTADFEAFPPSFSARRARTEHDITVLDVALPDDARARISSGAQQVRATPFAVVAAGILGAMQEVSGDDLAGLMFHHHGRFTPEGYATLGLFTQGVPLHLRGRKRSWDDTTREVFERSVLTSEHVLPLGLAGEAWGETLTAPRTESGVFLGIAEGGDRPPNLRLPGTTAQAVDMVFEGAASSMETIVMVWQFNQTDPQVSATYDRNAFDDETVKRLVQTAVGSALGASHADAGPTDARY